MAGRLRTLRTALTPLDLVVIALALAAVSLVLASLTMRLVGVEPYVTLFAVTPTRSTRSKACPSPPAGIVPSARSVCARSVRPTERVQDATMLFNLGVASCKPDGYGATSSTHMAAGLRGRMGGRTGWPDRPGAMRA